MSTPLDHHLVALDRLTAAEAGRAGAKAYNCARLKQAEFTVPDGLVLLSTAPDRHLASITDHPWFDTLASDERFAVRSSGIGEDGEGESFAGIHQTVLNVPRGELTAAVAVCRASGRSATALEYRRAKGLAVDAILMGVLIQRMVHPIAAGVAFTINPVTGARHELVINASWGLGEALVSGHVDPDEFVVRKDTGELLWSRVGDKDLLDGTTGAGDGEVLNVPALTHEQVRELAGMLTRIEREYGGMPQDVEWCHDGTSFWIVQSRPVTTGRARTQEAGSLETGTQETEWTRANLAEVFPDLTSPQVLAAFEHLLNEGERRFAGGLMGPEDRLGPMVKAFCGRLCFNLTQMRHICRISGVAPAGILRSMGHAVAIDPADEIAPKPSLDQLRHLPALLGMVSRHLRMHAIVRRHGTRTRAYLDELASHGDPRQLSDADVWAVIDDWIARAPDFMQAVLLLGNVTFHELPLQAICARVGVSFEQLVFPQLAVGHRSVSAQQAFDLVGLADVARREPAVVAFLSGDEARLRHVREALRGTAFLAAFDRFIEAYGHRGRYEYDWSLPRYREDPTPLLLAVRAHLDTTAPPASGDADASATTARQAREAAEAWTAFEGRLSAWQRRTLAPRVRRSIAKIKQYYVWREQVRSDLVRFLGAQREWHLVLADRFVRRGWLDRRDDYFLLHLPEIAAIIRGEPATAALRPLAARRREELARYRAMQMPLLMRESELPSLIRMAGVSPGSADDGDLSGLAVSGGCVEAEVVVVRDPGDFGRMKRGAILVAPATDPSWTPLFTLASGVIVEVGGVLSHASTIAREYGLPAVANVRHATRRLRTGERVRLDATHGVIQRLPSAAAIEEARDRRDDVALIASES